MRSGWTDGTLVNEHGHRLLDDLPARVCDDDRHEDGGHRVGQLHAESHGRQAHEHRRRGEDIGTGVGGVGEEEGAVQSSAGCDLVA